MTLPELTEDLFQYVCEFGSTVSHKLDSEPPGQPPAAIDEEQTRAKALTYKNVRNRIKDTFQQMREKVANDDSLRQEMEATERPLTFFVDSIISESGWRFAQQWQDNRLAWEKYNILTGDEMFFDLLEKVFNQTDSSPEARRLRGDQLVVYYTCLGLGFVGKFKDQSAVVRPEVRNYMDRILEQIGAFVDTRKQSKLFERAYNPNKEDRRQRYIRWVVVFSVAILIVGLLTAAAVYFWFF